MNNQLESKIKEIQSYGNSLSIHIELCKRHDVPDATSKEENYILDLLAHIKSLELKNAGLVEALEYYAKGCRARGLAPQFIELENPPDGFGTLAREALTKFKGVGEE